MKKLVTMLVCLFSISFNLVRAQGCPNVTVVPFATNESSSFKYWGVRVTLAEPNQESTVTVTGSIRDEEDATVSQYFTLVVPVGQSTAETEGMYFFRTSLTGNAVVEVQSVTPCPGQITFGNYDALDLKFERVGQFHNDQLANIISNYQIPQNISTYDAAVASIRDFNKQFFIQNEGSYFSQVQPPSVTNANFEDSKYFVNRDWFVQQVLAATGSLSFDNLLNQLNTIPDIDAANKNLLSSICAIVKSNLEQQITNEEFESALVNLANQWLQTNQADENAIGAKLTGCILSTGLKSCQFWREHTNDLVYKLYLNDNFSIASHGPNGSFLVDYYVAPVVAADAAGAIVSSIGSCIVQYGINGRINGTIVLGSACVGAISASTGLVGKVTSWISSLF